jgi:hypothetical protein
MIPFEEIAARLAGIGQNRAWLVENSGRSPGAIRSALAPNASSQHRSELLQKALSDAIEREEAKQAEAQRVQFESPPEIPAGHTAIYLSGQTYDDVERASRIVNAPTLAAFCHDVIKTQARLIIERDEGKANGTDGPLS